MHDACIGVLHGSVTVAAPPTRWFHLRTEQGGYSVLPCTPQQLLRHCIRSKKRPCIYVKYCEMTCVCDGLPTPAAVEYNFFRPYQVCSSALCPFACTNGFHQKIKGEGQVKGYHAYATKHPSKLI